MIAGPRVAAAPPGSRRSQDRATRGQMLTVAKDSEGPPPWIQSRTVALSEFMTGPGPVRAQLERSDRDQTVRVTELSESIV